MISAYQPPEGEISMTFVSGRRPKNSRVFTGCRNLLREMFLSERCSPFVMERKLFGLKQGASQIVCPVEAQPMRADSKKTERIGYRITEVYEKSLPRDRRPPTKLDDLKGEFRGV